MELNQGFFKDVSEKIDAEIESIKGINMYPIRDGIIDIEKYLKAKLRILWVLKEPYDGFDENGNPIGGNWDYKEVFKEKQRFEDFGSGRQTFRPLVCTSHMLLQNQKWVPGIPQNPNAVDAFKSTAYINVKKLPGKTKSKEKDLINAVSTEKPGIIKRQIDDYQPEVVILCGTRGILTAAGIIKDEFIQSGRFFYQHDGKNYLYLLCILQLQALDGFRWKPIAIRFMILFIPKYLLNNLHYQKVEQGFRGVSTIINPGHLVGLFLLSISRLRSHFYAGLCPRRVSRRGLCGKPDIITQ